MIASTPERPVLVDGQPKGVVFYLAGRWRWRRMGGVATDSYAKGAKLADVKAHIVRVCRGSSVEIKSGRVRKPRTWQRKV